MFSYFSSSVGDEAIGSADKPNEDVPGAGTLTTEQSNTFDDEISDTKFLSPIKGSLEKISTDDSATSWKQAHEVYCMQHGTLKATIQQVLGEICEENQEIPWELPRRSEIDVIVEAKEFADFLQSKRGKGTAEIDKTPVKLSESSWFMSPIKMVSAVASIMKDPDDDVDEWIQEGDDAFVDDEDARSTNPSSASSSSGALAFNTPIINTSLAEFAIVSLENEISSIPPDEPLILGVQEWNTWAKSTISEQNVNNKYIFGDNDNNILLQVLIDMNKATMIQRQNQKPRGTDVVILSSKSIAPDGSDCIPENFRIPLSLWDIQNAEEKIEQKLKEWSEQAALCTQNALQYKKLNQITMAKTQLAKRRVIQQRIDSDSRLQIQLLQTKNAIESAHSNRSVVDLMSGSAKLLRQLRAETPLEEIDETMDDLQCEIDDLQEINDTISSLGNNNANAGTDDELLKELESLTMNENTTVTPSIMTSALTETQDDSSQPIHDAEEPQEQFETDSSCNAEKEPILS